MRELFTSQAKWITTTTSCCWYFCSWSKSSARNAGSSGCICFCSSAAAVRKGPALHPIPWFKEHWPFFHPLPNVEKFIWRTLISNGGQVPKARNNSEKKHPPRWKTRLDLVVNNVPKVPLWTFLFCCDLPFMEERITSPHHLFIYRSRQKKRLFTVTNIWHWQSRFVPIYRQQPYLLK